MQGELRGRRISLYDWGPLFVGNNDVYKKFVFILTFLCNLRVFRAIITSQ